MGKLRQRNTKSSKTPAPAGPVPTEAATANATQSARKDPKNEEPEKDEEQSAWDIILRHPLFWGILLLGIPYGLHVGYRYVLLQQPQWINTVANLPSDRTLRPAVTMTDPRQLLIVGSIASATSQVAHELSRTLHMEIGHEDSDSMWQFVRDGTVSWFHGVRFMDPDHKAQAVPLLCKVSFSFYKNGKGENYGFGPTLFGTPNYTKSFLHPNFRTDWMRECERMLSQEYGCARTQPQSCATPFARTVTQHRHPRKLVASLVNKYCNSDGELRAAPQSFLTLLLILFLPSKGDDAMQLYERKFHTPDHCPRQMAQYVLWWYGDVLLPMVDDGTVDGSFAVESSGVCSVGELVGLSSEETVVYAPNHHSYVDHCMHNVTNQAVPFGRSRNIGKSAKAKKLLLTFPGLDDDEVSEMETRIQDLATRMGYST